MYYSSNSLLYFQLNIPVLTMPFALPTIVMIYVTDKCGLLYRVKDMSYPEKQAYEWHTRTKLNENHGQNNTTTTVNV